MTVNIQNATEVWITNPSRSFSGSAPGEKDGAKVEIVIDKQVYTAIVTGERWSWTPPVPLSEGEHVMSVRIIDVAGNMGAPALRLLHVDTTPPATPVILQAVDNFGDDKGLLASGSRTDDTTPGLKGVAEPLSIVKIYDGSTLLGSVKADKNGLWQLEVELGEGSHQLHATATDGRNWTSEPSETFALTVDVRPEGIDTPPVLESVYDDIGPGTGELTHGDATNDNKPTLSGSGVAGQTVEIFDNGVKIGEAGIAANGKWSFTPASDLADGLHEFTVAHKGSDVKSPGWALEIDTEVPDAPEIGDGNNGSAPTLESIYDDVGPGTGSLSRGDVTNDSQPTFSGSGTPGQKVEIFDNGSKIGEAGIAANGKWSFTPASDLADGLHEFTVAHKGSDVKSPGWALEIDTEVPDAPEIASLSVAALLSHASEELLIDNGRTQLVLEADAADAAQLAAAIKNSDGSWVQQAGSLTVAGVQYQVYSHSDSETELLVQAG